MKSSRKNLILTRARVKTFDSLMPEGNWIAIGKDKIRAVGVGESWKDLKDKNTEILDLDGKTVLPGFIDPHIHFVSHAKRRVTLDLSPRTGVCAISDIQTRIRHQALGSPAGKWILGGGYDEFHLAEKRHPNRLDLDLAAPHHPVRLAHRSGHAHVLNSQALKRVGIRKETGDPDGGIIDRHWDTGEPTGLLYEMGDYLSDRIPPMNRIDLERGLRLASRELVSLGITSIEDASAGNGIDRWRLFQSLKQAGLLKLRVNMMLGYGAFERIRSTGAKADTPDSPFKARTVKIILDTTTGRLHPDSKALHEMVREVHQAGLQVAIHAIEEEAIEACCRAIAAALDGAPRKDHRHRIEHCSVCPPSLAKRIASLGITVVTQPPFLYYNGKRYLHTVPGTRQPHLYPFKTLFRHGIQVAASSDCPVVPPDPLMGIYAAVSRRAETGEVIGGEEMIPVADALCMYTQNAARAAFEEAQKGTIAPGKLADLVVLSGDPTMLSPGDLKNLNAVMTIIGGEVVWDRPH